MNYYISFFKKEIKELICTYKLLILAIVFLFFGILSPMLAKLTPQLLEAMQTDSIQVVVTETTAVDSWSQFFKNINQLGFIVLIIVFSEALPKEVQSGTLINIITKGVSRSSIILAKISVAYLCWTISYLVCSAVCWIYTMIFWDMSDLDHVVLALLGSWLFGLVLISVLILGQTIKNTLFSGLMTVGAYVVIMFILNIIPDVVEYTPLFLTTSNLQMMLGVYSPEDYVKAICISLGIIILSTVASIKIFDKSYI